MPLNTGKWTSGDFMISVKILEKKFQEISGKGFQKIFENISRGKPFHFRISSPELVLFLYTKLTWRTWGGPGAIKRAKSLNSV